MTKGKCETAPLASTKNTFIITSKTIFKENHFHFSYTSPTAGISRNSA